MEPKKKVYNIFLKTFYGDQVCPNIFNNNDARVSCKINIRGILGKKYFIIQKQQCLSYKISGWACFLKKIHQNFYKSTLAYCENFSISFLPLSVLPTFMYPHLIRAWTSIGLPRIIFFRSNGPSAVIILISNAMNFGWIPINVN